MEAKSKTSRSSSIFHPRTLDIFKSKIPWGGEAVSGITVGLITIPMVMAIGIACVPAGTETPMSPPAIGLVTTIIAGFLIALLGGSRILIGGPTAAFIPIILLVIEKHGYAGMLIATMMAGVILVIMGITRMGALIKFIPAPVISGFMTGFAIVIISTQLADFFGITEVAPRGAPQKFLWIVQNLPNANPVTLCFGVVAILLIVFWPKLKMVRRVPSSIVVVVGATIVACILGLGETAGGLDGGTMVTIGSKFKGIPAGLPPPTIPTIEWATFRELLAPAMTIALMSAMETLLCCVVVDGLSGDRHDSNTTLIALGAANFVCPFFGGIPVSGAVARTSTSIACGAKTPIAGIIHAAAILAIMMLFARWAALVPLVSMSAILIIVAVKMGRWGELVRLHRMPRSDAFVLLVTLGLCIMFDLVVAVQVGMLFAAALFVTRVAKTTEVSRVTADDVLESPEQLVSGKDIPDGVLIYRVFGPFLFGAAEKMRDILSGLDEWPRVLILRMHLVSAMDTTALYALESVVEQMQARGGTVILSGLHHQPLAMLQRANFVKIIGRENLVAHFDDALKRVREILDFRF